MIRLLKLEYSKFKNHSLIILLLMLYVIFFPTIIFLGKEFKELPEPINSTSFFYTFPSTWDWLGYVGSHLSYFFLGLVAVFSVVNEIGYKTFRQNVISGLTRHEFFMAKFYSIVVISLAATVLYAFTGLVIGAFHTEGWTLFSAFDNSWAILRYFLMCMGYMSFALMCGFIIRKSGVVVLFYIVYGYAIDAGIKWGINAKFSDGVVRYLPINSMEDLMPLPFYRFLDFAQNMDLPIKYPFLLEYWQATLSTIVWSALFLYLAYRNFLKRDL